MSRLTVYRVEHPATGRGPFSSSCPEALRDAISAYCGRTGAFLPEVHVDCPGFEPGYHYCGVWPLSKVNEWFGPFREQLLAEGFVLMAYDPLPTNVCSSPSEHQVGFAKYEATPRRQLPWPKAG
ncbi:hypothetical protein [Hymenobacter sp. YC55]|uniref:hypothetical protein n=1 Tax=Hymenobacter sp. YC55 TaxID=3034019 RepID=UPI0023F771D4|nr:hypothetical protein [Hymenobacter sp. YC55]MDF7815287.1 hypothetical protein [Hymenobacter sp. YC55]